MHAYIHMQLLITQYTHAGVPAMHAHTHTHTHTCTQANKHAHACTHFVTQKIKLTTYIRRK